MILVRLFQITGALFQDGIELLFFGQNLDNDFLNFFVEVKRLVVQAINKNKI
jgi:hypothetical protein